MNGMTCIQRNKLNQLARCKLPHDILNPSKRTKILNSPYSCILNGCMNTERGRSKFKNFRKL